MEHVKRNAVVRLTSIGASSDNFTGLRINWRTRLSCGFLTGFVMTDQQTLFSTTVKTEMWLTLFHLPTKQKGLCMKRNRPRHVWYRDRHPALQTRMQYSAKNQKSMNISCGSVGGEDWKAQVWDMFADNWQSLMVTFSGAVLFDFVRISRSQLYPCVLIHFENLTEYVTVHLCTTLINKNTSCTLSLCKDKVWMRTAT